jgi:hypothetical protein
MQQPGTMPSAELRMTASTTGGQMTIKVNETSTLPPSLMDQAPYNYSGSVQATGSYSNGISKGNINVHAITGISSPLTSFKMNYHGNKTSLTVSGNASVEYGTYAGGVLNATTIGNSIAEAQKAGLNMSFLNTRLSSLPYGPFSVEVLTIGATYGADSAVLSGYIQLSGNMTALPLLLVAEYAFGSTVSTAMISATVVTCDPAAPASCTVELMNSGGAAASVIGCGLTLNGTYTSGEVVPANPTIEPGDSVNAICEMPTGTAGGASGSMVSGMFALGEGAMVPFEGTWDPPTDMAPLVTSTSTSSQSTQPPSSFTDVYSAYAAILSSFQDYSYSMAYSGGVYGLSLTAHATQNLNLNTAMKFLSKEGATGNVPASASSFLNSTRVDMSNFKANMTEAQQTSGEEDIEFHASGITIKPSVALSGGTFNESALFNALGASNANLTLVGGSSQAGSVSFTLPAGSPPPKSSSPTSAEWVNANMSKLAGIEFSAAQATTTTTSTTTTTPTTTPTTTSTHTTTTTTTSTTSTTTSTSSSTTMIIVAVVIVVIIIIAVAAYLLRGRSRTTTTTTTSSTSTTKKETPPPPKA